MRFPFKNVPKEHRKPLFTLQPISPALTEREFDCSEAEGGKARLQANPPIDVRLIQFNVDFDSNMR